MGQGGVKVKHCRRDYNQMNTQNFDDFGYRELKMAAELLTAYKTDRDKTELFGDQVRIEFNRSSGHVFLIDENYQVAMMNNDVLEDWLHCEGCDREGFRSEIGFADDRTCAECYIGGEHDDSQEEVD